MKIIAVYLEIFEEYKFRGFRRYLMNLENFVLTYLAHAALHSLMDGHIVLLYSIEEAMANTAIDACG